MKASSPGFDRLLQYQGRLALARCSSLISGLFVVQTFNPGFNLYWMAGKGGTTDQR